MKFKKPLTILLLLSMMFSVAACGKPAVDEEKVIISAAIRFSEAVACCKDDKLVRLCSEGSKDYLEGLNLDFVEEYGEDLGSLFEITANSINYEIKENSVSVDGKEAEVKVNYTILDFDSIVSGINEGTPYLYSSTLENAIYYENSNLEISKKLKFEKVDGVWLVSNAKDVLEEIFEYTDAEIEFGDWSSAVYDIYWQNYYSSTDFNDVTSLSLNLDLNPSMVPWEGFPKKYQVERDGDVIYTSTLTYSNYFVFDEENGAEYDENGYLLPGEYAITVYDENDNYIADLSCIVTVTPPVVAVTPTITGTVDGYTELEVADVYDEGNELLVYSWNEEVPEMISQYSNVAATYEYYESNIYEERLNQAFASGEGAPDLFACDSAYVSTFVNSDDTLPINSLGIAYGELADMYDYTLRYAADSNGVIKGLSPACFPNVIFYNRDLAYDYFGVSDPEDVASYFSSWDAVIDTARNINSFSGGSVKLISAPDEITRIFIGERSNSWVSNGSVVEDPFVGEYFDIVQIMLDEELTWNNTQWSDAWTNSMSDGSVLSYWGPSWLGYYSMGLLLSEDEYSFGASGTWGVVPAPSASFWGGTWVMASGYCDMKASTAQIMRDICLSQDSMQGNLADGRFVNSISFNESNMNDSSLCMDRLGGQNPYPIYHETAMNISLPASSAVDQSIENVLNSITTSFIDGTYLDAAEAEENFYWNAEDYT